MQNNFRFLFFTPILAIATACATFDEPVVETEIPQDIVQQDSQRLLIPDTQPEDTSVLGALQKKSAEPAKNPPPSVSDRLIIPLPENDKPESETAQIIAQVPTTDTTQTDSETGEASGDNVAATPTVTETLPHHRTDDINVVTWRAERGHIPSQLLLGRAYFRGDGVPRDMEQARLWLELASVQGNQKAQYELGLMYFIGAGVQQDYVNAHAWWNEAAVNGNDKAQQRLGYMYSEGLGVERDYNQAKNWYLSAAQHGNAEAQTLLGSLLHEGNRITPDYTQALKWYERAAKQGHPHAQYALAILHHDGLGTPQDYIKCAAWVDVALANRYTDELGARDQCRSQLNEQSNAAADSLAALWKSQYVR